VGLSILSASCAVAMGTDSVPFGGETGGETQGRGRKGGVAVLGCGASGSGEKEGGGGSWEWRAESRGGMPSPRGAKGMLLFADVVCMR